MVSTLNPETTIGGNACGYLQSRPEMAEEIEMAIRAKLLPNTVAAVEGALSETQG